MKLPLISLTALLLVGCGTNDSEAIKALDDNGFTNISITDRGFLFSDWKGCSDSDGNWYYATATNPTHKQVSMLVCCVAMTSFKGCTVRSK